MNENIFQTYIADSPVDVKYYVFTHGKYSKTIITSIIVMPDNRPLYKTRTAELNQAIIELIEESKKEEKEKQCTTSVCETINSA